MINDAARDAALREEGRAQERADLLAFIQAKDPSGYYATLVAFIGRGFHEGCRNAPPGKTYPEPTPDASQGSAPVVDVCDRCGAATTNPRTQGRPLFCQGCAPAAPQGSPLPGGDPLAETAANVEFVAGFFDRYTSPSAWPDSCGPAVALLRALRERRLDTASRGVKTGRGGAPVKEVSAPAISVTDVAAWLRSPAMTAWVVMETSDIGKRCAVLVFTSLLVDKLTGIATTLPEIKCVSPVDPRNPPEGGALEGCNHIGPFSDGGATEPQQHERNQLYNAGFEQGAKHAEKQVVRWLRAEKAKCIEFAEEMRKRGKREEPRRWESRGRALSQAADSIAAGDHIQPPAPAIPQSGDEKEGT